MSDKWTVCECSYTRQGEDTEHTVAQVAGNFRGFCFFFNLNRFANCPACSFFLYRVLDQLITVFTIMAWETNVVMLFKNKDCFMTCYFVSQI